MGYLSQKKQEQRKNFFLHIMAVLMIILTAGAFANSGFSLGFFNLFHLYCLSVFIFIYALWVNKYKSAVLFALILMLNYTFLAASSNIFLSDKFDGDQSLRLSFDLKESLTDNFLTDEIKSAGSLVLAGKYSVPFVVLQQTPPLTIIRVDLNKAQKKEYRLIFEHLQEFILKQDNPVIIFGEFGIPAWSPHFKKFLQNSDLTVKNRLLFTGRNILKPADFYILGFREMGIANIEARTENGRNIINTDISFNPAQL